MVNEKVVEDSGGYKKVERVAHSFDDEPVFFGEYLGEVESQFDLANYLFSVRGEEVIVFGRTALNTKMGGVKPGQSVKIVYLGKKVGAKTKRQYDDFDVYVKE